MDNSVLAALATIVAMLLTLIGMVATGVWVVAGLRASIRELTVAVQDAVRDIEKQTNHVETLGMRINDHETRIVVLEGASAGR